MTPAAAPSTATPAATKGVGTICAARSGVQTRKQDEDLCLLYTVHINDLKRLSIVPGNRQSNRASTQTQDLDSLRLDSHHQAVLYPPAALGCAPLL